MDKTLRELQRQAEAGDPEAMTRLARETMRAVDVIGMVSGLTEQLQAVLANAVLDIKLVEEALENIDHALIAGNLGIDAADVAAEIDLQDLAYNIDVDASDVAREIADTFDAREIAEHVEADDIAQALVNHLNMDDLAERIASHIDPADIAEHVEAS